MTLIMSQVYAADACGLRGATLGKLHGADVTVAAEWVHIEGTAADGSLALAEVLAGRRAPRRGSVRLAGRAPHRSPGVRRRLGSLLLRAALPPFVRVKELIEPTVFEELAEVADKLGVISLLSMSFEELDEAQTRALDLALCLSLVAPLALVLVEPFVALAAPVAVQQLLRRRADAGVCVVTVAAPTDLAGGLPPGRRVVLADRTLRLRAGQLRPLTVAARQGIVVALATEEAARALAAELVMHDSARAVKVSLTTHGACVELQGEALAPLARAAARVVVEKELPVMQIQPLYSTPEPPEAAPEGA